MIQLKVHESTSVEAVHECPNKVSESNLGCPKAGAR